MEEKEIPGWNFSRNTTTQFDSLSSRRTSRGTLFFSLSLCPFFTYVFHSLKGRITKIAGDLERLRRYWMTGTCKPGKEVQKSSDPLALEQFLSAFLLLMMGILLAAAFLLLEHLYFKYVRQHLARSDGGGCCALFSLVSRFRSKYISILFDIDSIPNLRDFSLLSTNDFRACTSTERSFLM